MTIEFHCPHCNKSLKTSDKKAGVKANCPGCGEPITVPSADLGAVESEPPALAVSADSGEAIDPQDAAAAGDTRPCPMCGAEIKRAALRCRFCGENLVEPDDDGDSGKIEAGDILTRSWNIFQKNLGILVGSTLVLMAIGGAVFLVAYMGMAVVAISMGPPPMVGQQPDAATMSAIMAVYALFMLLFLAANAYLGEGYQVLLIRIARGERADLMDLFSGRRYFWKLFWGNMLFGALAMAGFAMCFVPYVFVLLIFWPYSFVIVDQNTGIIESFQRSRELTRDNLMAIFLLTLAIIGINLLGEMACFVGLIFSIPLSALASAVGYCRMARGAAGHVPHADHATAGNEV